MTVLVFGGYGVFGREVSRELARRGLHLIIVGRDRGRAEAAAQALGPAHQGVAGDANDLDGCRVLLRGAAVAVDCVGPGDGLLLACLQAGCHYVDIVDDRAHAARVREWGPRFDEAGLCAAYGCSSLPGLSGALAVVAAEGMTGPIARTRVSLFIGNDNPKGLGAIASLVRVLGRPIRSPQGTLRGFGGRELVGLPSPFGRRAVYYFDSAEYDLFPALLGAESIVVKVGFESRAVNVVLSALARCRIRPGDRLSRLLAWLGSVLPRSGSSGGAVMTELFGRDGSTRFAAAIADANGQRMAALPCVAAAAALAAGTTARGAMTAYELLGARALLQTVEEAGFRVVVSDGRASVLKPP
jgi:hypothetical protein